VSTFYIVRHAHSQAQENNLMPDKNSPLSFKGIEQAKKRGKALGKIRFDIAFSSNSRRSYQTALCILLFQKQSIPLIIAEKLGEKSWGKFEGKKYEEINKALYEKRQLFIALPDDKKLLFKYTEKMESDEEACIRFINSLKEINEKYKNKTILVVTHGTIMKTFLIKTTNMTYAELPSGSNIDNTGYLILDLDGKKFQHISHIGIDKKKKKI
jgi:broad specificity phosphatase PhoE